MTRFASIISARRTRWVLVVVWLVIAGVAGPAAGKFSDVQKNDASSFLPGNAESTRVLNELATLPGGQRLLGTVVYARDGGLRPADLARANADREALRGLGIPGLSQLSPVVPSRDGAAASVLFSLPGSADGKILQKWVDQIRVVTARSDVGGLQVAVTGPAGFLADSFHAFEGIDSTLLLAAMLVVAVLLLLIYRSPVLWLVPVVSAGLALVLAQAVVYELARSAGLVVNGQSAGVLAVLVFGAGTDYALLLIARYREELTRHTSRFDAMRVALRNAGPAIVASGTTVVLGLLTLLVSELNSDRGMGPIAAIGIGCALIAMLTLLPAILLLGGRWLFWPFTPHFGSTHTAETGPWRRVGEQIARRPRPIWIGTAVVLGVLALGLADARLGLRQTDAYVSTVESVRGQQLIAAHFPAGESNPAIVVAPIGTAGQVVAVLRHDPGVVQVQPLGAGNGLFAASATLRSAPDSAASYATVAALRRSLDSVSRDALVGGNDAVNYDVARAAVHDRTLVMPLVLVVVFVILALLLRALVAPLLLILTVVLSFTASLGVSVLVFHHVFGFAGEDQSFPLFAFIFLVALGIDYNIFLMSRVHEEAKVRGTRHGVVYGLAITGGVITSAGVVLAGTFAVLGVLPLVVLAEVGFVVAFGVLLDTLVVRSVLVPALTLDVGRRVWWPSRLGRDDVDVPRPRGESVPPVVADVE